MDDGREFPPAPWRLRGQASVQLHWIALERARALVPPDLNLVPSRPGRTLGAVYCASYTEGSSLRYRELIVSPGLVRHRHRLGAWISHIYVDDRRSLAGGHEIWSLPKKMARFQDDPDDGVTVFHENEVLCRLPGAIRGTIPGTIPGAPKPGHGITLPLFVPVISMADSRVLWFKGRGRAVVATAPGAIEIPRASSLAALGLSQGRRVCLSELDLLMHAPTSRRRG